MAKGNDLQNSLPIYRHFLSGAPDTFRLSTLGVFVLVALGGLLFSVVVLTGRPLDSAQAETLRQARQMLVAGDWLAPAASVPAVPPLEC